MQVRKLSAYILRVALRKPFRHASAERHHSDNIVVRSELTDGTFGWGEGVPRDYVTGETAAGALEQFAATPLAEQITGDASNWHDVLAMCDRFQPATMVDDPRGCYGNSLRSAVELSLLDAYGKVFGEPVSRAIETSLTDLPNAESLLSKRDQVQYSTTIDAEHGRKLWRSALKMRVYGFAQCKVKVGADAESDSQRMRVIRRWIGPRVDLRVDANEAWRPENLVARAEGLKPFGVTCIEQPMQHEELAAQAELRSQVDTPIMLDESLTSLHDAQQAIHLGACDLFNIRISKCGGVLNSMRLAALAHEHGLGYQLGCHPGETGILSAAGRHLATTLGGIRYLEGSYDHHVLAEVPTTPDHTFGYGGRAPRLTLPGLGVELAESSVVARPKRDHVVS
ncbi:dipeptide epimerase [Aeoliella sp. ICT_H6.2]|uniref:Dipeptide epimerase n=1 Tax=Aeoliella straminimaris TaxID=2954799 RepID=A0A9X2F8P3_9BACT|nr:dipeptide epimerase [Aeoliella straminimaris]MCO6043899.1 dipeptide epimerase [Aeoliella straminimaris]